MQNTWHFSKRCLPILARLEALYLLFPINCFKNNLASYFRKWVYMKYKMHQCAWDLKLTLRTEILVGISNNEPIYVKDVVSTGYWKDESVGSCPQHIIFIITFMTVHATKTQNFIPISMGGECRMAVVAVATPTFPVPHQHFALLSLLATPTLTCWLTILCFGHTNFRNHPPPMPISIIRITSNKGICRYKKSHM